MATYRKVEGKKGVSYQLMAFSGYDAKGKKLVKYRTWKPPSGMSENKMEKQAAIEAAKFEEVINKGIATIDGKVKFEEFASEWLKNVDIAPKTKEKYVVLLRRANQAIGHIRLENIQPHHLEAFYANLKEPGVKETGGYAIPNGFAKYAEKKKISRNAIAKMSNVSTTTIGKALKNERIGLSSAKSIATALDVPIAKIFDVYGTTDGLSPQSILHHHRLIATILGDATRKRIIPRNVANREFMDAPKLRKKEANYLNDEQARRMVELLLWESDIRKKAALLLCLFTGVRRAEFNGIQWKDMKNRVLHVRRSLQWQKGKGQ